jgi:hypothetical protein
MFPYHHDPETDAETREATSRVLSKLAAPFKRLGAWLTEKMPPANENGVFVPPMGFGGIGGYYPAVHAEDCGCGHTELSKRDRWDMPIAREDVVTGPAITPELQQVFGFFGTVTGIVVDKGDSIDVTYDNSFTVTFIAVTGVPREGL